MTDLDYMTIAMEEAQLAVLEDEVPIGAVIVYHDQIIAKAHNEKTQRKRVTAHAEILAIERAEAYLGYWHLDDCILYVTLEPCMMCTGAIIQSRMKKVVIGARDTRWAGMTDFMMLHTFNHHVEIEESPLADACSQMISDYFRKKREQKT